MRLASAALALAAAAALGACGTAREAGEGSTSATTSCTRCHQLDLGPPLLVDGQPLSIHEFHIEERGVACASCHPGYSIAPEAVNAATHQDGRFEASVAAGPVTKAATFSDATATWPPACTSCHLTLPSQ
jgi:cytochrome c553